MASVTNQRLKLVSYLRMILPNLEVSLRDQSLMCAVFRVVLKENWTDSFPM